MKQFETKYKLKCAAVSLMLLYLPYELFEGKIFEYLNGTDLVTLSSTSKRMQDRLYSISILGSLKIKPQDVWPSLRITYLEDDYSRLSKINLKFPKISISSTMYPKLYDHLPPHKFLECTLTETNFDEFQPIEKYNCHKLVCKELWNNNLELMMKMKHLRYLTVHASLAKDAFYIQQNINQLLYLELDGFAECDFVALCPHLSKLKSLIVRNTLTDFGAAVLAQHLPSLELESLVLENNYIAKDGLTAICQILKNTKLKDLNLVGNEFDIADLEILINILPDTNLKSVLI
ncbi:hypothetical protein HDV06_005688 [Boothiomyces sp. JEL0866]|nr:hypothetical protein HDV06_005688 [Boothiomyces sp. JEL0866]